VPSSPALGDEVVAGASSRARTSGWSGHSRVTVVPPRTPGAYDDPRREHAGPGGCSPDAGRHTHAEPECCITVRNVGPLSGEVFVPGAKNSVLKLMAASLLADGIFEIGNVPDIADVAIMSELLIAIGLRIHRPEADTVVIENTGDLTPVAPYELVERIRASINVLGPLLTRCGHVRLSMPGGDDFGARPIDLHVKGLEAMGAEFKFAHGYLEATAERLHGAHITFDFPSVGATENLVTAAVLADGVTVIDNAAREPEIIDLCNFLVKMGARIEGIGTSTWVTGCRARSPARRAPTRRCPTASRPPPTSPRAPLPGASSICSTRSPSTWRWCSPASATWAWS
jgi:hypothetical protein